jgi:hypothetical protein
MHSTLDIAMQRFEQRMSFALPGPPFDERERSTRSERLERAARDYWYFDRTYFPAALYQDGYSKPARFHRDLVRIAQQPGMHIIMAPRKHGKTATLKKYMVWALLHRVQFAAIYAATITTASNILDDIATLIRYNSRITADFQPEIVECNSEQMTFVAGGKMRRVIVASEGRSLRGATMQFGRPELLLVDDIETRACSLSSEAVQSRYYALKEAYASLSAGGTAIVLGNNFDERCLLNQLKCAVLLPEGWTLHEYNAWSGSGPLWRSRYPASSEAELRAMLKVSDESEWLADYQQEPAPPEGTIFPREHLVTYSGKLPSDARGVVYCDPNLAKRGRGDTTAMVALLYSPSTDRYYIPDVRCRSYSQASELLDDLLALRRYSPIIGFDGNVAQESFWTQLVRDWCRIRGESYPAIIYCRYKVDELAKNASVLWCDERIMINEQLLANVEGKRFLTQVLAFAGKQSGRHDDAADALICAIELLHERRPASRTRYATSIITDYYAL